VFEVKKRVFLTTCKIGSTNLNPFTLKLLHYAKLRLLILY
jgi:hypothetical protein